MALKVLFRLYFKIAVRGLNTEAILVIKSALIIRCRNYAPVAQLTVLSLRGDFA